MRKWVLMVCFCLPLCLLAAPASVADRIEELKTEEARTDSACRRELVSRVLLISGKSDIAIYEKFLEKNSAVNLGKYPLFFTGLVKTFNADYREMTLEVRNGKRTLPVVVYSAFDLRAKNIAVGDCVTVSGYFDAGQFEKVELTLLTVREFWESVGLSKGTFSMGPSKD